MATWGEWSSVAVWPGAGEACRGVLVTAEGDGLGPDGQGH